MTKFKVRVGEDFEIYDARDEENEKNGFTIVVVPDTKSKKEPKPQPSRAHALTLLSVMVCAMLTLSMAGSYAYGASTGDYSLLKAFPELINKLLSEAISLVATKK